MDELLSKIAILRQVSLFKELTLDVLQEIACKLSLKKMIEGETIFATGDFSHEFYIISSGEILLQKSKNEPLILKENDSCGESGLLNEDPRLATATCKTEGTLLHLNRETFNSLIITYPEILSQVTKRVIYDLEQSNEPGRFFKSQRVHESVMNKTEKNISQAISNESPEVKTIFEALREAPLFKGLPDEALTPIARMTQWKKANKGDIIFSKDDESDYMYIIFKGSVFIKKGNKEISLLNGHDFFGEAGIVTNQPRMASAIAVEDCLFLQISKESFKTIISKYPSFARSILFKILSYHYPNYQLQDQDTLFQIEKLLPGPDHTLDPKLFFESLELNKSKSLTVIDLYKTIKSDHSYYIDEKGLKENKPEDSDVPILGSEECKAPKLAPNHVEVEANWSSNLDGNGKFIMQSDHLEIPVIEATKDSLAYYGGVLLNSKEAFTLSEEDFPIWNILIGEKYLNNFILTEKGGGMSFECQMDKPHFHMPASKESHGYYILGKKTGSKEKTNRYHFTAFKIPFGKAVYTYPGAIHCDVGLQGNWLIGCTHAKKSFSAVVKTNKDQIVNIHFTSEHLAQKSIFITIHPK